VVRNGHVAAHCTYIHPITIEHAGGIQFESVEIPETLALVQKFSEALNLHGQFSFDYMKDEKGYCMVECNPRPTDGVALMEHEMFGQAVMRDNPGDPMVLEAGRTKQIEVAIIRDMVKDWKEIPRDLKSLFKVSDLYYQRHDVLPALYQFLSYSHVRAYRKFLHTGEHKRTDIMAAQFYDICWDGSPIP